MNKQRKISKGKSNNTSTKRQFIISDEMRKFRNEKDKIFQCRFRIGIIKIRDNVSSCEQNEATENQFNEYYEAIYRNLEEALLAKDNCIQLMTTLEKKLARNTKKSLKTGRINVNTPPELNLFFKDFFIRGRMAIDLLAGKMANLLGFKIHFFFSENEQTFQRSLERFKSQISHPVLTKLLIPRIEEERKVWIGYFCNMRTQIEHHGFQLPNPRVIFSDGKFVPLFMELEKGKHLRDSLEVLWDNLFEICEDILVLLLATKIKHPLSVQHLPEKFRDKNMPLKYEIVFSPDVAEKIRRKILKEESPKE